MKIGGGKKVVLIANIIIMVSAPIFFYLTDGAKSVKNDLKILFRTELCDEIIASIIERPALGARGNAKWFKMNSHSKYYPIQLESENYVHDVNLFQAGVKISKNKNSYEITLTDNEGAHKLNISNPLHDTLNNKVIPPLIFFCIFFLIQLFILPNSFYEKYNS